MRIPEFILRIPTRVAFAFFLAAILSWVIVQISPSFSQYLSHNPYIFFAYYISFLLYTFLFILVITSRKSPFYKMLYRIILDKNPPTINNDSPIDNTEETQKRIQAISDQLSILSKRLENNPSGDKKSEKKAARVSDEELLNQNIYFIRSRIVSELTSVTSKAQINLWMGALGSLLGMGLLIWYANDLKIDIDHWESSASIFFARLSIIVFIEIFSFFFLKLYRSSFLDVKYYQNEMTNIEMKILAIRMARIYEDYDLVAELARSYSQTDRNYILRKGETTAEIETMKSQFKFDKNFSDQIKSLTEVISKIRGEKESSKEN